MAHPKPGNDTPGTVTPGSRNSTTPRDLPATAAPYARGKTAAEVTRGSNATTTVKWLETCGADPQGESVLAHPGTAGGQCPRNLDSNGPIDREEGGVGRVVLPTIKQVARDEVGALVAGRTRINHNSHRTFVR